MRQREIVRTEGFKEEFASKLQFCGSLEEAVENSSGLVILTDEGE